MPVLVLIAQQMGPYLVGQPLLAKPDDYVPSRKMGLPRFFLIKIPQAALDSMPEMFSPFGAEGSPEYRARSWSLDMENLPTQARATLGATGVLDVTSGPLEWNDIHDSWLRHDGVAAPPIGEVTRVLPKNGQSLAARLAARGPEFAAQLVAERARGIGLAQAPGQNGAGRKEEQPVRRTVTRGN